MSAKAAAHRAVRRFAGASRQSHYMVVVLMLEVLSGLLLVLGCRTWSTA
jgi:cytochrome b subunit of formate dehydrogenase